MLIDRKRVFVFCALAAGLVSACHPSSPAGSANTAVSTAGSAMKGGVRRTLIESRPATDLPGWETRLYLIEYAPGTAAPLHVHSGVGVGLVLSGRFESAFGDEPVVQVRAGEGFIERAAIAHRVFRNPSSDQELRFVVAFTLRSGEEPFRLGASLLGAGPR